MAERLGETGLDSFFTSSWSEKTQPLWDWVMIVIIFKRIFFFLKMWFDNGLVVFKVLGAKDL